MTPKEKAIELIVKMSTHDRDVHPHYTHYIAKQCALIAVDEIINEKSLGLLLIEWWQEVKKEINLL